MKQQHIDNGEPFDFGLTSENYAKYRDIYPPAFFQRLIDRKLCIDGQDVLDIGTGTGVLPRSLYPYHAKFTGVDIAEEQIKAAEELAQQAHMDIRFLHLPVEQMQFPSGSFDVVTACQCFIYFDHKVLAPLVHGVLREDGHMVLLYMAWLPQEDEIAGRSEELILKYNPSWNGCREQRHTIDLPDIYRTYFDVEAEEVFDLDVPFSKESWNGRIHTCRGVDASLDKASIAAFDAEHRAMLETEAPEVFKIHHYGAITILKRK